MYYLGKFSLVGAALIAMGQASPASNGHSKSFKWSEIKHVLAFGDSYTFVQGTNGFQNFSFIADYLNFAYTSNQLLDDRIVQNDTNSTSARGPNWVEYLTGCGVKQGLTNPKYCEIQLWDFAFAGADISLEYLPLHHNYSVQLVNQTQQFLTYGQPVLSKIMDPRKTLVAMWIGINDISDSARMNVDFPSFYDTLIKTMFAESVARLHAAGYKNFIFLMQPPLDKTPGNLVRTGGPLPNATMIEWWDSTLVAHNNAFQAANADVTAMVFDSHSALSEILDNAGSYGITNTTNYCAAYDQPETATNPEMYGCLPLDQYFWYNSGHISSHVHRILAGKLREFLKEMSKH